VLGWLIVFVGLIGSAVTLFSLSRVVVLMRRRAPREQLVGVVAIMLAVGVATTIAVRLLRQLG
jgi:hypothetical protein